MDFHPYEIYTQTYIQKYSYLNTESSKKNLLQRDIDFFTTFDKYYFALKRLKTREFCKNTNVFGFKNGKKCFDAQNLPDVTVSKALIGQIFQRR